MPAGRGPLFGSVCAVGGALVGSHAANVLETTADRYPARFFWWVVLLVAVQFTLAGVHFVLTVSIAEILSDARDGSPLLIGARIVATLLSAVQILATLLIIGLFLRDVL